MTIGGGAGLRLVIGTNGPSFIAAAGFAALPTGAGDFFAPTDLPARAGFFATGFEGLAEVFAAGFADFFTIGRADAARAGAVGFLADFFLLDALANELPSRRNPRSARLP